MTGNQRAHGTAARERPQLSRIKFDTTSDVTELSSAVDLATRRTESWLVEQQHADGHWCAELQGDTILESEYILLLAWLGQEKSAVAGKAARYLLAQQLAEGGWSQYPGGELDISTSVKAYFALKLTGHDAESEPLRRARSAIRAAGGGDAVNSFTRFYLALLGQLAYDHCPAVPPELVLLPTWSPVNIYRFSAWSRTIFVPLSVMWAHRPVRRVPAELGISELFLRDPQDWPPLRCPGMAASGSWLSWERFFRITDRLLKWFDRCRIRPLRRRALKAAEMWMLERFEESDGLGAIFPPIVWSVVALKCLGYDEDAPPLRYCRQQLADLIIEEDDTIRLQPCKSPVWDTALSLRALAGRRKVRDDSLQSAIDWLLAKEVRRPGDWSAYAYAEPAGWYFEYRNVFYPDVDDTIMVMMALQEATESPSQTRTPSLNRKRVDASCERACRWILAMQNADGGWGAFDKNNDREFLCHVPFADHNAMIDPSTPDITGRVLEALPAFGMGRETPAVERAVTYLRGTQEEDGSWFGRWGVNHVYGTWQVLTGLTRIGVRVDDPAVVRGVDWLLEHQQPSGGWGESPDSYEDAARRGTGTVTASQTAWALLGLISAGKARHAAIERGIRYLVGCQRGDGTWDEPQFTGTGFPRVFYLRYHMYPIYFPLLALKRYRDATREEETR